MDVIKKHFQIDIACVALQSQEPTNLCPSNSEEQLKTLKEELIKTQLCKQN